MEKIELQYPASRSLAGRAQVGVVGSGDMEVLFEPEPGHALQVRITTSVDNSQSRWRHLFERLRLVGELPGGRLEINDFGATPGVARLRIEQVFEEAADA
ncbi:malonate decarboxylase acyl carrier protein [Pantoea sp. 1.19]|uniref:malonate decarboxylase acyl carrier protein n=1 Tax=Pantoea sp. 1.19 TaxID=1925589 RepID=UPI000948F647|nr:malonate decarboxylase acyl carrier protein [Pantoea sp. 1.19]